MPRPSRQVDAGELEADGMTLNYVYTGALGRRVAAPP